MAATVLRIWVAAAHDPAHGLGATVHRSEKEAYNWLREQAESAEDTDGIEPLPENPTNEQIEAFADQVPFFAWSLNVHAVSLEV